MTAVPSPAPLLRSLEGTLANPAGGSERGARILVWQWSRLGVPPRLGVLLARGLARQPGVTVALSLSTGAQLPPALARCDLPVETYETTIGFVGRALRSPLDLLRLRRRVAKLAPDLAICALPGPLDLLMAAALRSLGVGFVVLVHDAEIHPGDGRPFQMALQRWLCRSASAVGALTDYVATILRAQGLAGTPRRPLVKLTLPPVAFDLDTKAPRTPGPRRLLCFGRLLAYKGLDILAEAMALIGPRQDFVMRVVGTGPESVVLDTLRAAPNLTVENRWVPEEEIGTLLGWSDALILPYREASQSGVAAAALAAGRPVIATRVGGLMEQLGGRPGATLCAPTAAGVAAAIRDFLDAPPIRVPPEDEQAAWDSMAASLLRQVTPLLPASARP